MDEVKQFEAAKAALEAARKRKDDVATALGSAMRVLLNQPERLTRPNPNQDQVGRSEDPELDLAVLPEGFGGFLREIATDWLNASAQFDKAKAATDDLRRRLG